MNTVMYPTLKIRKSTRQITKNYESMLNHNPESQQFYMTTTECAFPQCYIELFQNEPQFRP